MYREESKILHVCTCARCIFEKMLQSKLTEAIFKGT